MTTHMRVQSLLILCAIHLPAQNIGGSISGQITDSQGLPVDGAAVEIVSVSTGLKHHARSGASGRFLAPSLPQSVYKVEASKAGFQPAAAEQVRVAIGESPSVRLTLVPATNVQSVTVTSEVSVLRAGSADQGSSYGASPMNSLPMLGGGTGRNFRTQAYLTPGVSLDSRAPAVRRVRFPQPEQQLPGRLQRLQRGRRRAPDGPRGLRAANLDRGD